MGRIFDHHVPLAYQNPYPISGLLYGQFMKPSLVTFRQMIFLISKSQKRGAHCSSSIENARKGDPIISQYSHKNAILTSGNCPAAHSWEVPPPHPPPPGWQAFLPSGEKELLHEKPMSVNIGLARNYKIKMYIVSCMAYVY